MFVPPSTRLRRNAAPDTAHRSTPFTSQGKWRWNEGWCSQSSHSKGESSISQADANKGMWEQQALPLIKQGCVAQHHPLFRAYPCSEPGNPSKIWSSSWCYRNYHYYSCSSWLRSSYYFPSHQKRLKDFFLQPATAAAPTRQSLPRSDAHVPGSDKKSWELPATRYQEIYSRKAVRSLLISNPVSCFHMKHLIRTFHWVVKMKSVHMHSRPHFHVLWIRIQEVLHTAVGTLIKEGEGNTCFDLQQDSQQKYH